MITILGFFLAALSAPFKTQRALALEKPALRQQLAVLGRSVSKRAKLRPSDRASWVWLSRFWPPWRKVLLIVQPHTVSRWHREGFRRYWK